MSPNGSGAEKILINRRQRIVEYMTREMQKRSMMNLDFTELEFGDRTARFEGLESSKKYIPAPDALCIRVGGPQHSMFIPGRSLGQQVSEMANIFRINRLVFIPRCYWLRP